MARRRKKGPLSEFQMEIMNIVWDLGEASVANVVEQLATSRTIARSTAQTMLMRLEEKGWLKHRKDGSAF